MINENDEFENPNVDPGFEGQQDSILPKEDATLKGREDEREHNIDSNISIKEMREGKTEVSTDEDPAADDKAGEDSQNDALNYKNDRENGAYNPKNI